MPKLGDFKVEFVGVDKMSPATKKARESTENLSKSAGKLRGSLTAIGSAARTAMPFLAGAAVIGGVYKLATGIFETGLAFEKMQFQLRGVSDSIREADSQFRMIREFAYKTPHLTEDVTQAFIMLKAVGLAPTIDKMKIFGDAAFAMGRNVMDISQAIISLETEVLRRLGVRLDRTGEKAIVVSGNMRHEVENDLDAIRAKVIEVWEKRFGGAMEKGAGTATVAIAEYKSAVSELEATLSTLFLPTIAKVVKGFTAIAQATKEAIESTEIGTIAYFNAQLAEQKRKLVEVEEALKSGTQTLSETMNALGNYYGMVDDVGDRTTRLKEEKYELIQKIAFLTQTVAAAKGGLDYYDEAIITTIDETKNLKTASKELAAATTKLQGEYNNLFLTEREQLELWQKEQLAIKGINEQMVNAIYNQKLVSMVTKEIVEKNREAATVNRELMDQYQELTLSDRELLDVWRDKMLAIDGVNTKLLESVYAIQAWKMEQEGIIGFGPVMPGYREEWIDQLEEMGEASSSFREVAVSNLTQVQSAMQTTFSALAAGSEAWKGALIGLLASLVHTLIKMGMKKRKEMVAGSAEHSAKAAESAAEQDWVGVVLHAIAAALFGTAAGSWASVGKGHRGIPLIGGAGFPGLKADERPIIAQTGEGLLSRRGVAAIGGPEVVEAANRGVSIGSQSIVMTNTMGPIQNLADVEEIGVLIGEKILSTIRESA